MHKLIHAGERGRPRGDERRRARLSALRAAALQQRVVQSGRLCLHPVSRPVQAARRQVGRRARALRATTALAICSAAVDFGPPRSRFSCRVEKLWVQNGVTYFFGPIFIHPEETEHEPTKMFYKREVFMSQLEETLPMTCIIGTAPTTCP